MSFYTGVYGSGMYTGTNSSKYGGTALRQKNSMYSPVNNNFNVQKSTVPQITPKNSKSKKLDNGKYALATISLMAMSAFVGYNMKGGLKNIGSGIKKVGSAIENSIVKIAGNAKNATKNLAGKLKGVLTKP